MEADNQSLLRKAVTHAYPTLPSSDAAQRTTAMQRWRRARSSTTRTRYRYAHKAKWPRAMRLPPSLPLAAPRHQTCR